MPFPLRRPATESPLPHAPDPGAAPFVLEERQENLGWDGAFTPTAALWLSPAMASGGLLRDLSPEEIHLLLGVLCGLTPNGTFVSTPRIVAKALGISPLTATVRLRRMRRRQWQLAPLLHERQLPNGLHLFAPGHSLMEIRRSLVAPMGEDHALVPDSASHAAITRVPREQAIDRSRALYARPRGEVEADIERFLSGEDALQRETQAQESAVPAPAREQRREEAQAPPESGRWLALKRALVQAGVPHRRADELLGAFPPERIQRQLDWLPRRNARNPAAYLSAAIEGDYRPPAHHPNPDGAQSQSEPPENEARGANGG